MNLKKTIITSAALGTLLLASTASAFEGYQTSIVNPALGTTFGAGAGCISCHAGGITSKTTLTTPFFNSYNLGLRDIALGDADSDGDGFTNKQEAIGNANNFNVATVTPFTLAQAAAGITDTVLTNFVVKGDSAATAKAFSDPYALATAGTTEVLGKESLTINNAPVDIYYKTAGIDSTIKLYNVDPYGQGTLSPMTTGWTVNTDGSLRVVALPSGATSVTGVVIRKIPVVTAAATTTSNTADNDNDNENDSENDDEGSTNTQVGCVAPSSTTLPLLMTLGLLGLGLFTRREKG